MDADEIEVSNFSIRVHLLYPRPSAFRSFQTQTRLTLNEIQRYFVEEFAEEYREGHISRRDLLRRVLLITGGFATSASTLLALGCGSASNAPDIRAAVPYYGRAQINDLPKSRAAFLNFYGATDTRTTGQAQAVE